MSRKSHMKIDGQVESQRAPRDDGKEVAYGPSYNRAVSFTELNVNSSAKEAVTLVRKDEIHKGSFKFSVYGEKGCILPTKGFGPLFKAVLLEKTRLEDDFSKVDEEFYPTVKRLMDERRNWGVEFMFRGLSSFIDTLMEWTERIICKHAEKLKQVGIYGLAGASQYPYYYDKEVWKAFCEHWSALTNTLHHGGGEVGISLNDLKQICGLPILGSPYEEYLPLNKQLLNDTKCSPTVVELLKIHAKLCDHEGTKEVSWYKWVRHFYRGKHSIKAFGESSSSSSGKKHPHISLEKGNMRKSLSLQVTTDGELTAFIALLLSRFVLPGDNMSVRPETFMMASLMAQGKQISLAPIVLGHIYHGMGKVATFQGNPGSAKPSFGIHFIIGWLAEYFLALYRCRPDNEFKDGYPALVKYASVNGNPLNLYQARLLFRGIKHFIYRAASFGAEVGGKDYVDSGTLSDLCFEHLMSIRHSFLPIRVGNILALEPYYPNRFAQQFGFDQGIPSNSLSYHFSDRSPKSLEDVARAYTRLFRKNTGTHFYIPFDNHQGTYTYTYYSWWERISTPYLAQSCNKVKSILLKKICIERETIPVITDSRSVTLGLQGVVRFFDQDKPTAKSPPSIKSSPQMQNGASSMPKAITDKRKVDSALNLQDKASPSEDVNPKRARYIRLSNSDSSHSVGFIDLPVNDNLTDADNTICANASYPDNIAIATFPESSSSSEGQKNLELLPSENVDTTLQDVLSSIKSDWIRHSFSSRINSLVRNISDLDSPENLLVERLQILESIGTLEAMTTVNNVHLEWFISKIQELFTIADVLIEMKGKVDLKRIEDLRAVLNKCSAELKTHQARIPELTQRLSNLKEQEAELETLKEKIKKMEADIELKRASLTTEDAELQNSIQQYQSEETHL